MKEYHVKLKIVCRDSVFVRAENEAEAEKKAIAEWEFNSDAEFDEFPTVRYTEEVTL